MDYIEITPQKELSSFIKCFWEYKSKGKDIHHTIFPNGCFELIMVFEKGELASEYIFNREISSILDSILLLNPNFWGLKELDSLPFSDRTIEIGKKLSRIIREKEIDQEKQLLLTTVYTPDLNVEEVANITHWDRRRINRYFNKQFGLSSKTFLNIIRLRSSFESIKEGTLYPDLNYYDQSHYIKETKKYTGESPKKLLKNEDDRFLQFSVNRKP